MRMWSWTRLDGARRRSGEEVWGRVKAWVCPSRALFGISKQSRLLAWGCFNNNTQVLAIPWVLKPAYLAVSRFRWMVSVVLQGLSCFVHERFRPRQPLM